MKFATWLHALTEDTTPDAANDEMVTYDASASASKRVKLSNLAAGLTAGIPISGWIGAAAMTYASADDPTYTVTMTGDVSGTYGVGMRIKLTQATGGTKYFIITKVAVSGNTTLTLYGGTDYNLENEAISSPYYSPVKAPFGFPVDPTKWTVSLVSADTSSQVNPADGTWYNLGSLSLSIPIGIWHVRYSLIVHLEDAAVANLYAKATLSNANNTQLDILYTVGAQIYTADRISRTSFNHYFILTTTTKTTYYLNECSGAGSIDTLQIIGTIQRNIIEAACAYL